jgi:hypothetical protein
MEKVYAKQRQVFESRYMKMELIDGVLHTRYKQGAVITHRIAMNCVEDKLRFLDGNEYPAIVYDEGISGIDRAARRYLASDMGNKGLTAFAYIQKNILTRMLIDLSLRVCTPKVRSRTFASADEAIMWFRDLEKS